MNDKEITLTLTEALLDKIKRSAEEQGKTPEAWIVSLLGEKFPQESEADAGMSQEEEDKVKERLKALGYMD